LLVTFTVVVFMAILAWHDMLVVVCLAWQVNIAGAAWVCQETAHQDGN